MTMEFILLCMFISIIARCILINKHDIKWWKGLIPGYNKYILGKISNKKKLGIINAILHPILFIYFIACFIFEVWIMREYSSQVIIPTNANMDSKVYLSVPDNIANIALYSKYGLILLSIVTMIVWCMMMWEFTKIHKRSPWWILLWFSIPVIPYCAFAMSNEVVIDGKRYKYQKVEINESKSRKS